MNKTDLINEMVNNGITYATAFALINPYSEITPFSYLTVQASKKATKYKTAFGNAYSDYGLYIFYTSNTHDW